MPATRDRGILAPTARDSIGKTGEREGREGFPVKDYDAETPFLRSVQMAMGPELPYYPVDWVRGSENLTVSWFPFIEGGPLCYEPDANRWTQGAADGEPEAPENLMLDISSNGNIAVREGDGAGCYCETTLKAGDELAEFLDFYENARESAIGSSARVTKSLAQLIEGVYLLVPAGRDSEGQASGLLPLKGPKFAQDHGRIAEMLDAHSNGDDAAFLRFRWWDLGRFLDEEQLRGTLPSRESIALGDMILAPRGRCIFSGMLLAGGECGVGAWPCFVLRPRKEPSRMWLMDYFEHSVEAEGLVERIRKGWRHLPKGLANITVEIPSAKRDQVAEAIARRSARRGYVDYLQSAMAMREPLDQLVRLYQKRTRAAKGLYGELLDDLEALQHPLPFFLEYPFRVYRREDDHIRKVRAGQRLLGMLAKVPLYLVVEELLASGHPLGASILEELEKRPLSDGGLVDLQARVAGDLAELPEFPLAIFSSLAACLADTSGIGKLVSARNRMHHEPYDENAFLEALDQGAPALVERLRSALTGLRFLIPKSLKVSGGKRIVTAEDASGADSGFRIVDLTVTLPLDCFPEGELLVWREKPERTMPLGTLVMSKAVSRQSRDFGIFDRVQKNVRHFTYLRSD